MLFQAQKRTKQPVQTADIKVLRLQLKQFEKNTKKYNEKRPLSLSIKVI